MNIDISYNHNHRNKNWYLRSPENIEKWSYRFYGLNLYIVWFQSLAAEVVGRYDQIRFPKSVARGLAPSNFATLKCKFLRDLSFHKEFFALNKKNQMKKCVMPNLMVSMMRFVENYIRVQETFSIMLDNALYSSSLRAAGSNRCQSCCGCTAIAYGQFPPEIHFSIGNKFEQTGMNRF